MTAAPAPSLAPTLHVLAQSPRERLRASLRRAFPRRRARLTFVRTANEFEAVLREQLVDAAISDMAQPTEDSWRTISLARDFPSLPFFPIAPLRMADGATLARCVAAECADVVAEGTDDAVLAELVIPRSFSVRFAQALREAHRPLGLEAPLQQRAWRAIVACGGRTIRTEAIASQLEVTREHLSRSFSLADGPNLKRIIDLVRVIAAAELAKNAGYDLSDVSRVLGFASPSHLSSTSQRIVGTRSASLARLRTTDLIERFRAGRGRSRASD